MTASGRTGGPLRVRTATVSDQPTRGSRAVTRQVPTTSPPERACSTFRALWPDCWLPRHLQPQASSALPVDLPTPLQVQRLQLHRPLRRANRKRNLALDQPRNCDWNRERMNHPIRSLQTVRSVPSAWPYPDDGLSHLVSLKCEQPLEHARRSCAARCARIRWSATASCRRSRAAVCSDSARGTYMSSA